MSGVRRPLGAGAPPAPFQSVAPAPSRHAGSFGDFLGFGDLGDLRNLGDLSLRQPRAACVRARDAAPTLFRCLSFRDAGHGVCT